MTIFNQRNKLKKIYNQSFNNNNNLRKKVKTINYQSIPLFSTKESNFIASSDWLPVIGQSSLNIEVVPEQEQEAFNNASIKLWCPMENGTPNYGEIIGTSLSYNFDIEFECPDDKVSYIKPLIFVNSIHDSKIIPAFAKYTTWSTDGVVTGVPEVLEAEWHWDEENETLVVDVPLSLDSYVANLTFPKSSYFQTTYSQGYNVGFNMFEITQISKNHYNCNFYGQFVLALPATRPILVQNSNQYYEAVTNIYKRWGKTFEVKEYYQRVSSNYSIVQGEVYLPPYTDFEIKGDICLLSSVQYYEEKVYKIND